MPFCLLFEQDSTICSALADRNNRSVCVGVRSVCLWSHRAVTLSTGRHWPGTILAELPRGAVVWVMATACSHKVTSAIKVIIVLQHGILCWTLLSFSFSAPFPLHARPHRSPQCPHSPFPITLLLLPSAPKPSLKRRTQCSERQGQCSGEKRKREKVH